MTSKYGFGLQGASKEEKKGLVTDRRKEQRSEQEEELERRRKREQENIQAAQPLDAMVRDVLTDFYTAHGHSDAAQDIKGPVGGQTAAYWTTSAAHGDLYLELFSEKVYNPLSHEERYEPLQFHLHIIPSAIGLHGYGEGWGPPTEQGLIDILKEHVEEPSESTWEEKGAPGGGYDAGWWIHEGSGEAW